MPVRGVRRRYVCFTIYGSSPSEDLVWETIKNSVLNLYGISGFSIIDPILISYDEAGHKGVVRCRHDQLRCMRTALAYVTSVGSEASALRVDRVSGTIKGLKRN